MKRDAIKLCPLQQRQLDTVPRMELWTAGTRFLLHRIKTVLKGRVKYGASEGIRTLDIHVGNVTLYQTELRSLPNKPGKIKPTRPNCKPRFPALNPACAKSSTTTL